MKISKFIILLFIGFLIGALGYASYRIFFAEKNKSSQKLLEDEDCGECGIHYVH